MTANDWLGWNWLFVRRELPRAPARVLELGCGPYGGFVPLMSDAGYQAVGVDPEAPEEPGYRRVEFENFRPAERVDAVVACASLHHVATLDEVLARVEAALTPGGVLVVVEWDWERFDEGTATWCFSRLSQPSTGSGHGSAGSEHGWLQAIRDEWASSGRSWVEYMRIWAEEAGLHTGQHIRHELDARFERRSYARVPYFFPDLAETGESDERAAIDAGLIRANGIRYVGRPLFS